MNDKLANALTALEKIEVHGKANLNYLLYAIQTIEEVMNDEHGTDV